MEFLRLQTFSYPIGLLAQTIISVTIQTLFTKEKVPPGILYNGEEHFRKDYVSTDR
ncbi:MAG: hypothetical protein ACXWV5_10930 [Flavitalea sp.]